MGFAATDGREVLCRGAGPADEDPHTITSRRTELYGVAALLELLVLLQEYLKGHCKCPTEKIKVRLWVDSSSAIKQFQRNQHSRLPKPAYPDNADILAHIKWLYTGIQTFTVQIEWVKSHQDSTISRDTVNLQARINVLTDKLAMGYWDTHRAISKWPRSQGSHDVFCRMD